MIRSFRDRETEVVFDGRVAKHLPRDIQRTALRKLVQLHAATRLQDLRDPPGNRVEQLSGQRSGEWSIRINSQWRVCFRWHEGDAYDVEIADYH